MSTEQESVLVVAVNDFRLGFNLEEGLNRFTPTKSKRTPVDLLTRYYQFHPRNEMEVNENYRQLIPYVVFVCGNKVFVYRRMKSPIAVGEPRLEGKLSIGIGGHINGNDHGGQGESVYDNGLYREIAEECVIGCKVLNHRMVGFINDTSNAVGRVHLGVLHIVELESESLVVVSDAMKSCGFMTLPELGDLAHSELVSGKPGIEIWSKIVLEGIFDVVCSLVFVKINLSGVGIQQPTDRFEIGITDSASEIGLRAMAADFDAVVKLVTDEMADTTRDDQQVLEDELCAMADKFPLESDDLESIKGEVIPQPAPMDWRTVQIVCGPGYECGVHSNSDNVLVLGIRKVGEPWVDGNSPALGSLLTVEEPAISYITTLNTEHSDVGLFRRHLPEVQVSKSDLGLTE